MSEGTDMLAGGPVPPFVRLPSHVDGDALFSAALRVEAKIQAALPNIDEGLVQNAHEGEWDKWFRLKISNSLSYLQIYAYIIAMAIPESRPKFAEVRLLDYGGGWGLMSFLATEAGIGHVTYLDNTPAVASAAKIVSEVISLPFDDFIVGSEEDLVAGGSDRFDSVVSSDVIEHVYDTDIVFAAIGQTCSPGAHVFHHTGANPKSVHQRRTLMKLQRFREADGPDQLRKLHAEGRRALWEDRREFIQSYAPEIADPELQKLALSCRGLDQYHLESAIKSYLETRTFPIPSHPTNTCRLDGYWIERLMDPNKVVQKLGAHGFRASLKPTYWGPGRSPLTKRLIKHGLNFMSSLSLKASLRTSFYYGVQGIKQDSGHIAEVPKI